MNNDLIVPFAVDLWLKSSAICAFTWVTLQVWRHASAAQRGYIWCVALALIAVLPFMRLIAPHWALSFSKPTAPMETNQTVVQGEPNVMVPDEIVSASPVRASPILDWATLGLVIWLAGIFLLVSYRLAGTFLLYRCRRLSSPLEDDASEKRAAYIRAEFGITRWIDIRISHSCKVPVTWGTWRPVVMLPAETMDWPQEWLESALRHEMGHVKNNDHLKRWIAFLTCAFYWPNPLVWASAKQLQLAQEEASDNFVLRGGVSSQEYATQLIQVIRLTAGRGVLSLPAVAMARPSTIEGRLSALLDETRNRGSADRRLMLVGTLLAMALGLALGAVQLRAAEASSQEADVTRTAAVQASPINNPEDSSLNQKLNSIIISFEFSNVTLKEAAVFLGAKSREIDPDKKGINFVVDPDASASAKPITLSLNNVSLGEALRYVCQLAGVKFKVDDYYIVIGTPKFIDTVTSIAQPDNKSGQATVNKLKSISIPQVDVVQADVADVLRFLTAKSRELDPDKKGINFVLGNITSQDKNIHRQVTFRMENLPLIEVLAPICGQTNLQYSIEDNVVYFKPKP